MMHGELRIETLFLRNYQIASQHITNGRFNRREAGGIKRGSMSMEAQTDESSPLSNAHDSRRDLILERSTSPIASATRAEADPEQAYAEVVREPGLSWARWRAPCRV